MTRPTSDTEYITCPLCGALLPVDYWDKQKSPHATYRKEANCTSSHITPYFWTLFNHTQLSHMRDPRCVCGFKATNATALTEHLEDLLGATEQDIKRHMVTWALTH